MSNVIINLASKLLSTNLCIYLEINLGVRFWMTVSTAQAIMGHGLLAFMMPGSSCQTNNLADHSTTWSVLDRKLSAETSDGHCICRPEKIQILYNKHEQ